MGDILYWMTRNAKRVGFNLNFGEYPPLLQINYSTLGTTQSFSHITFEYSRATQHLKVAFPDRLR